jgi:Tfp pilus assembly PilM family ATPase
MSLFSLSDPTAPDTAVEIAAGRVAAAALDRRAGQPIVAAHAVELLPPDALVPSLTAVNTHDRSAVMTALNRVLERIGRPRRVGLIVPDVVAKVSLLRFESVPARAADLDQLVRWQVRKAAPFPIDEAQVSYVRGIRLAEGQEFIVTAARRSVVEEYEGLCAEAGAHAGIVDLSTFNVINAVLAAGGPATAAATSARVMSNEDWLLVNVATDSASIAILRGPHVIFFRNRAADAEADGTVAELVHQTGMYYEDRLKGPGFTRVILAGSSQAGADLERVRTSLEQRVPIAVEAIDPRQAAAIADRISASAALLDTLAPLVGLLLRDRVAVTA